MQMGGAQIWLKRECLAHTGAHKINNAVGQVRYRGTSLIRNSPLSGPYRGTKRRALWWS